MKRDEMPMLSEKEFLILDMLIGSDEMYGLELVKESRGSLKRGTVYVTLNRMEDKGFVKSRLEELPAEPTGPARRLYSATGLGASTLKALQAARAAWAGAQLA